MAVSSYTAKDFKKNFRDVIDLYLPYIGEDINTTKVYRGFSLLAEAVIYITESFELAPRYDKDNVPIAKKTIEILLEYGADITQPMSNTIPENPLQWAEKFNPEVYEWLLNLALSYGQKKSATEAGFGDKLKNALGKVGKALGKVGNAITVKLPDLMRKGAANIQNKSQQHFQNKDPQLAELAKRKKEAEGRVDEKDVQAMADVDYHRPGTSPDKLNEEYADIPDAYKGDYIVQNLPEEITAGLSDNDKKNITYKLARPLRAEEKPFTSILYKILQGIGKTINLDQAGLLTNTKYTRFIKELNEKTTNGIDWGTDGGTKQLRIIIFFTQIKNWKTDSIRDGSQWKSADEMAAVVNSLDVGNNKEDSGDGKDLTGIQIIQVALKKKDVKIEDIKTYILNQIDDSLFEGRKPQYEAYLNSQNGPQLTSLFNKQLEATYSNSFGVEPKEFLDNELVEAIKKKLPKVEEVSDSKPKKKEKSSLPPSVMKWVNLLKTIGQRKKSRIGLGMMKKFVLLVGTELLADQWKQGGKRRSEREKEDDLWDVFTTWESRSRRES